MLIHNIHILWLSIMYYFVLKFVDYVTRTHMECKYQNAEMICTVVNCVLGSMSSKSKFKQQCQN